MEVLGGNGYTEELSLARIVREMPVNSIWEGSGNIMCLDVLRAFASRPRPARWCCASCRRRAGRIAISTAAFERFAAFLADGMLAEGARTALRASRSSR